MRKTGHYQNLGSIEYFIPNPLPPAHPPLEITTKMTTLYGQAMQELAKLNEMAHRLPDKERFIKAYVTKEALLSSAIEGIHTTLIDVFTQSIAPQETPSKQTQLVVNYTKALDAALTMIKEKNIPITNRVLKEAHKVLMSAGEGDKANPGIFRKQSVRVGDLVPPPAQEIEPLMTDLEKYINTDESLPPLIKAGLAHLQFETIHPFLDGNGRIGRLLIVLMLIEENLLNEPILYPSYYFKKYRMEYYKRLDAVRTKGDFEGWITYYLTAIKETSINAYQRAEEIDLLQKKLVNQIENEDRFTKSSSTRLHALSVLFSFPVITVSQLAEHAEISYNTAKQIVADFTDLKIITLTHYSDQKSIYYFKPYIDILEKNEQIRLL